MTHGELFYLLLVIAGFGGFAAGLGYCLHLESRAERAGWHAPGTSQPLERDEFARAHSPRSSSLI